MPRPVLEIIRTANPDVEVTETTDLRSDLGMDSLELLSVVLEIEGDYGLQATPSNVLDSFKTVGDVVNYVRSMECQSNSSQ